MRDADQLMESANGILHDGLCKSGGSMRPLFSGGHDSLCAVYVAAQSRWFHGSVYHIDTGIGARYTREFVEGVCQRFGWKLEVFKSNSTFERFIRERGFPGPGAHQWVYTKIKERCIYKLAKGGKRALVTGARQDESVRRMGHSVPVKVGEMTLSGPNAGKIRNKNRVWTSPCIDWTKAEQALFMDEFGLPTNRVKVAIGLSGECFCGAFAAPGERRLIQEHAPDVETEINRLTAIAKQCGTSCEWGKRPIGDKSPVGVTGPLCSSCDIRAGAAGIKILDTSQFEATNGNEAKRTPRDSQAAQNAGEGAQGRKGGFGSSD